VDSNGIVHDRSDPPIPNRLALNSDLNYKVWGHLLREPGLVTLNEILTFCQETEWVCVYNPGANTGDYKEQMP